jgi:uncharacterized protein (TIGR02246 family)
MKRGILVVLAAALIGGAGQPAGAAAVTEAELMRAATDLGRRYDSNYAAKDPAAMAALYEPDGVLVSPAGPIVRGRDALVAYYTKRFASGAHGHKITVREVHTQGEGGYGLLQFEVTAPAPDGSFHEEHGSIVAVYRRDGDVWHMRLVEPSVPPGG